MITWKFKIGEIVSHRAANKTICKSSGSHENPAKNLKMSWFSRGHNIARYMILARLKNVKYRCQLVTHDGLVGTKPVDLFEFEIEPYQPLVEEIIDGKI